MASAWIRWRKNRDGIKLASLQWRDAEERIQSQALSTSDERVAHVYLDAKRRELGKPRSQRRTASQSLHDTLEGFLAEKAMNCRPATVEQYRQRLEWLFAAWADIPQPRWDRAL
ncbi:MAG: hypothetical protein O2894_05660, partial [Planctomycetota bacterium]|nr:hypothetical protein [Planctomycetota bacterium]